MNKIYCFINSKYNTGDVVVMSVSCDGYVLGSHFSSSETWGKHDIGLTSNCKHEKYEGHFPDGYELEWVDDPFTHEGFLEAKDRFYENK